MLKNSMIVSLLAASFIMLASASLVYASGEKELIAAIPRIKTDPANLIKVVTAGKAAGWVVPTSKSTRCQSLGLGNSLLIEERKVQLLSRLEKSLMRLAMGEVHFPNMAFLPTKANQQRPYWSH